MLYRLLRVIAAIALRWYYAEIVAQGAERGPRAGPLLIVANHPNALIDPLLVGTTLSRPVLLTAKATLFDNPALSMLLHAVGVVPLRRAKDEGTSVRGEASPDRNAAAFRSVTAALRRGGAVLIFPEGISHDAPAIAPLRSGAARIALQAYSEGVRGIQLLAVGLIYEKKERPNSDVLVRVGDPVVLDSWLAGHQGEDVGALTETLEVQLRAVTLNFATAERAVRAVRLARIFSALATEPVPVAQPRSLDTEANLAYRIDRATAALADAPPDIIEAADQLSARLDALERELDRRGIALEDVRISVRWSKGTRFLFREGTILLLLAFPLVLGRVAHWIPIQSARALALRSLRRDASRDQPAMRTIIFGLAAVVVWYVLLFAALEYLIGLPGAIGCLLLIFVSAHALRLGGGRLRRALRRARTFLALRSEDALHRRLIAEIDALVAQSVSLERDLLQEASARP
jgi:glycerol-3-phosphate O-acyltransferase / dihydroxyacetone phosphate acyltransferase